MNKSDDVLLAQGIIFRGGALDVVWPQFLALAVIGALPQDHRPNGVTVHDMLRAGLTSIKSFEAPL